MQPEDRRAFLEIVIGFAELKGKQLSAPGLELFWNAMQDWTIGDFRTAANYLVLTCQFMPTPKDFEDLRKGTRPSADEAWLIARESLRWTLQGYTLKDGVDPLIAKAIQVIGGPNAIALCEAGRLHFVDLRFRQAYESLSDSNDTRTALPQLARTTGLRPMLASQ